MHKVRPPLFPTYVQAAALMKAATGSARSALFDWVELLEQSEIRESAFWEGICRDLKESLGNFSYHGRDASIRRAFSKLSRMSRQLWKESGVELLHGR